MYSLEHDCPNTHYLHSIRNVSFQCPQTVSISEPDIYIASELTNQINLKLLVSLDMVPYQISFYLVKISTLYSISFVNV